MTTEDLAALDRDAVLAKVREHLASELEIPEAELVETARFREDLDADSLDLYELVMEMEDTYGIQVPEEAAAQIATVADAVDFVVGKLGIT
jgi:acyl carrier protein